MSIMRALLFLALTLTLVHALQVGRLPAISISNGAVSGHLKPLGSTTTPLFMSTLSDDDDRMEKKVQGRKRRVFLGYRGVAIANAGACALAFWKSGMNAVSCYTISGPLLAGGTAYVLSGAAVNNRLSSDTYKRLNLYLGTNGLIGLIIAASARQTNKSFWYYWSALSFVTLVNSIKGYGYGVKGWKLQGGMSVVKEDWTKGIKSTFQTLFSIPPNLQALWYLVATIFVGSLKVLTLFEIIALYLDGSKAAAIAPQLSNYARLSLLTGTSFTLKDAADRGRLDGTTFIRLNLMSSLAFAAMSAYWKQQTASFAMVGAAAALSIMTAQNGMLALAAKGSKEK